MIRRQRGLQMTPFFAEEHSRNVCRAITLVTERLTPRRVLSQV